MQQVVQNNLFRSGIRNISNGSSSADEVSPFLQYLYMIKGILNTIGNFSRSFVLRLVTC